MTEQERAIIDAAILWALCPDAGGYRTGRDGGGGYSVEGACEILEMAVADYIGRPALKSPRFPKHWTVAQMRKAVEKRLSASAPESREKSP